MNTKIRLGVKETQE